MVLVKKIDKKVAKMNLINSKKVVVVSNITIDLIVVNWVFVLVVNNRVFDLIIDVKVFDIDHFFIDCDCHKNYRKSIQEEEGFLDIIKLISS